MEAEEPCCTRIELRALWSDEGRGQDATTLLKKYPSLGLMTDYADEDFLAFRRYVQDDMKVIFELKMLINGDLGM